MQRPKPGPFTLLVLVGASVAVIAAGCGAKDQLACVSNEPGSCSCHDGHDVGATSNDAACPSASASGLVWQCTADPGWPTTNTGCECVAYSCLGDEASGTCSCGQQTDGKAGAASCPSSASNTVCCLSAGSCDCYYATTATSCNGLGTEVASCTAASYASSIPPTGVQKVVASCRVAGASSGSSGTSATCAAAGPGTCGDTAALNHCNCDASCYRDSAAAGSGYSCHHVCTSDADCANLYSFATTCQPFTADTGTALKECR